MLLSPLPNHAEYLELEPAFGMLTARASFGRLLTIVSLNFSHLLLSLLKQYPAAALQAQLRPSDATMSLPVGVLA
jgi:hypothetical protein